MTLTGAFDPNCIRAITIGLMHEGHDIFECLLTELKQIRETPAAPNVIYNTPVYCPVFNYPRIDEIEQRTKFAECCKTIFCDRGNRSFL